MSYRLLVGAWPASSQRMLLGALLPLGHQVVTARSEAAALGLLRKEPTDLVVHAWPERGSSPARLAASLRKFGEHCGLLLLVTRMGTDADQMVELSTLVDDVISEPVDPVQLRARVRALLSHKQRLDELNRQNQQLKRSLEVVAQRVELLAHGLRNPSTVIHANLEFALRALGPDSREVCAALRDAMDACRKSSGCVDDMLTIFESEQVGLALDIRRFDLAELVEEMVRASTWEACTRRVQSSHEVATGLYVEADRELLRRALENLIQNSLTNTLPGGRVHIDARIEETIEICVSNTGLLIPRVLRPHLFDRYLPGRRKQAARRIALGLYLCRCIAEAHRGSISLQQRQGYTTSFVIRLPRRVRAVVKGSGPAPRVTVAAENAATVEKSQEATRK